MKLEFINVYDLWNTKVPIDQGRVQNINPPDHVNWLVKGEFQIRTLPDCMIQSFKGAFEQMPL